MRSDYFIEEEQVAVKLVGLDDGAFDNGDYIEFYGRRNDGTQDTGLFYNAEDQIHKYYNLFSDETAFFLSLENGSYTDTPLRIETLNLSGTGLQAIDVHREEILNVYTNKFSLVNTIQLVALLEKLNYHFMIEGKCS